MSFSEDMKKEHSTNQDRWPGQIGQTEDISMRTKSYKIQYENEEQFYDGIRALIRRGLVFETHYQNLEIYLTGGY